MAMFARWSFSLLLLAIYVATFHVWMHVERAAIVVSGLVSTAVLSALFVRALRRRYFLNGWDAFWHGTVILDVFLEATLVSHHGDFSFGNPLPYIFSNSFQCLRKFLSTHKTLNNTMRPKIGITPYRRSEMGIVEPA